MKLTRIAAAAMPCFAVVMLSALGAGSVRAESAPPAAPGTAPVATTNDAVKEDAVKEGMPAPDFKLVSDRGDTVSLASLRGHRVVLYFYPKDMTSGCTAEACAFRDLAADMKSQNAVVLGVSPDARDSHQKFVSSQHLNFPLLVDDDGHVAQAYGVWKQRSSKDGRTWTGNERSTFLIDETGVIRRVWRGVSVQGHDAEVLAALKSEPAHAAKAKTG